ncbi:probable cytochrome P450 313a4 [Calliphora vicina]|uniref:probable cytochrome P450 313a4 n=1 Tax=Calliphora vicina TaxID=7373 RepID=UPI00325C2E18
MEQVQDTKDLIKTLLLTAFISLWLYWMWSRQHFYRFAIKFPGCFGYPVIGSFDTIKNFKSILQGLSTLFERCKSNTICVWMGFYPTVVSTDPEFIEKILSSPELLNKAKSLYNPVYQAFQGGIISSPVSVWQHNRKMINPSFHHKVLVSFLPVFHKGKNVLLSKMEHMVDNGEYKLSDIIQRITLGISVETTMGKTMGPGDQVDEEVISNFRFIMEKIVLHIMMSCIKIGSLYSLYFKYQNIKKRIHRFVFELVQEKLKRMNKEVVNSTEVAENTMESIKKNPNIFIDQAIEIYQKQKFSFNDIIVESNNIVTASFETTGNGILSALVMLATHPEVQERLYDEIINIFPEKDFEMEYEHLEQLPYLDMIINETLRLAPSIPLIGRHVTKDMPLTKDLVLPKDIQVIMSIFHVHRRKDIWGPNANSFDPDNFLPENMAGKHAYAYIPFSKGTRNCIGWRYALFAMKVIIVGIIRNYRLSTTTKYEDIEFTYHIALKYLNEPSFKIHRRN